MRPTQAFKMPLARLPSHSYYDKDNRALASLIRARQPYLIKNAVTGLCIVTFVGAVFTFTLKAVSQDDFSDVKPPDAPVQPATAPNASVNKSAGSTQ